MRRFAPIVSSIFLCLVLACHPRGAKSEWSFDDIKAMVNGRSAKEIRQILGEPDSRVTMIGPGERWTWWNYTYLDGDDYAPEERGTVVHLQIIFELDSQQAKTSARPAMDAAKLMTVTYILPDKP